MSNEYENINNTDKAQNTVKKKFVNNSGQGKTAKVPSVIKNKFNWGAFLLTWIWGIGNKTYITLLYLLFCIIPFVNLGLSIWFGIKGNEWAWQNKRFEGIKKFHDNQKKWVWAGCLIWFVLIPLIYFSLVFGIVFFSAKTAMDNPEKMDKAMEQIEKFLDATAAEYFAAYTIGEDENKFYIYDETWQGLSLIAKKDLLDFAAQTAVRQREKEYKEKNPNGHKYFSKTKELNRTRIYSANNKDSLLAEFYMDEKLLNKDVSFTDYMKAGMNAYKFYDPNDNAKPSVDLGSNDNNNGYNVSSYEKSNLKRSYSGLNQAITLSYALDGKYITETSEFIDMFTKRMSVLPEQTTNDSFTTADRNKFNIIPLRSSCSNTTPDMVIGEDSACAKIMVNDKYTLYLYPNEVLPAENSQEKQILEK